MSIACGTFVRLISDPDRSGVVQAGENILAGQRTIPVQFANGQLRWLPERSLEPVVSAPIDLADRFASGQFVAPEWLRRTLTRVRMTGQLSDVVYSMEATETDFYAYQFKPVLKLLGSPTDALLIADEVGLGKTIEAGLIWTELRARFECNRLLVLCPKTLREKWRHELDRRFGVDARIVDAGELLHLLSTRNGDGRGFAAIASIQGLRPPRGWDDEEEGAPSGRDTRRRLAQLLDEAADGQPLMDLLVVDEAHHLRNPATLQFRLGELLNAVTTHRVFLSATPIHLRNRDLHSLMRLIDADTFEYESTLDELISTNAPIVAARDLLMRPDAPVSDIIAHIEEASAFDLLADSKALKLLTKDIKSRVLDNETRAELAARLESVNQMSNYMVRTRRRDVQELRIVREPLAPVLDMHPEERAFYKTITREVMAFAQECGGNERFLASTPQRLLTSSPAAACAYWASKGSGDDEAIEETDDDLVTGNGDERPLVTRLAKVARELDVTERLERVDTKFGLLLAQLNQLWQSEPEAKIIIFSSFKPTLRYLHRRLSASGIGCELMHGSVREPRDDILRRFRNDVAARILLSSEVGSEGIDLQFCRIVVNYDLPWNPMRVEQRIGRVDRLGQTSPKVTILNLVYEGTIDATIYHRLYERLELTRRALGEFEAILGEPIREMELRMFDPDLSDAQKASVVDQTAQALEYRKKEEERLEQEAGALIRHGDYIIEKIHESRELHRWLSDSDILVYVSDRLARSFPGCAIEASPPGSETYRITLTSDARNALSSFVLSKGLRGTTRLLDANEKQRYRFTSSVAQRSDGRVENISQLHTLVRFAIELDERDRDTHRAEPVASLISCSETKLTCDPGMYVIGVRRWIANAASGRVAGVARIAYVGAAVGSDDFLPPDIAEAMASAAAEYGRPIPNFSHDDRLAQATKTLEAQVLPKLDRLYEDFLDQTIADIEDRASIRKRALVRHRDSKSANLRRQREKLLFDASFANALGDEKRARQLTSLVAATEGRLRKLETSMDLRLKQIDDQREVTPEWSDLACLLLEVKP